MTSSTDSNIQQIRDNIKQQIETFGNFHRVPRIYKGVQKIWFSPDARFCYLVSEVEGHEVDLHVWDLMDSRRRALGATSIRNLVVATPGPNNLVLTRGTFSTIQLRTPGANCLRDLQIDFDARVWACDEYVYFRERCFANVGCPKQALFRRERLELGSSDVFSRVACHIPPEHLSLGFAQDGRFVVYTTTSGIWLLLLDPEPSETRPGSVTGMNMINIHSIELDRFNSGEILISKDAKIISFCRHGKVLLWWTDNIAQRNTNCTEVTDVSNATALIALKTPHALVSFSPGSRYVAIADQYGCIYFLRVYQDPVTLFSTYNDHWNRNVGLRLGPVCSLAWSCEGQYLAIGDFHGLHLYDVRHVFLSQDENIV